MSSCALPTSLSDYGGHCRNPVPDCLTQRTTPELSTNLNGEQASASETAFSRRYDAFGSSAHTKTAKGGRRRKRTQTIRRFLRKRNNKRSFSLRKQRRTKNKRFSRKGGGVGFRLDLSKCPPGGLPGPTQYQTNQSDFF